MLQLPWSDCEVGRICPRWDARHPESCDMGHSNLPWMVTLFVSWQDLKHGVGGCLSPALWTCVSPSPARQYSHTDTHTHTHNTHSISFLPAWKLHSAAEGMRENPEFNLTINGSTFGSCSMLQCSCLLVMFAPVRLTISGFSSLGPGRETYFRGQHKSSGSQLSPSRDLTNAPTNTPVARYHTVTGPDS